MELHQIMYFLALARSLNFTRAAEQCNVTQTTVTKAVQRLEMELGGALIHRERRLTQLTDLGKIVLPALERAYNAAQSVRASAEKFQRKEIAPLKIALSSCVSAAIIESPLARIAAFMPGLAVELIEAEPVEVGDMLLNGHINAALSGDEIGERSTRVDQLPLFEERYVVLMHKNSPLAHMSEIPHEAMADAMWLERVGCDNLSHLWTRIFSDGSEPKISHRGRQLAHLQYMVSAGLGLMLWPEHAPYLPSLVARKIAGEAPRRTVKLFVVAGRKYSSALEVFVKIARVHDWGAPFPGAQTATVHTARPRRHTQHHAAPQAVTA